MYFVQDKFSHYIWRFKFEQGSVYKDAVPIDVEVAKLERRDYATLVCQTLDFMSCLSCMERGSNSLDWVYGYIPT